LVSGLPSTSRYAEPTAMKPLPSGATASSERVPGPPAGSSVTMGCEAITW
jgi:hypothetical protein